MATACALPPAEPPPTLVTLGTCIVRAPLRVSVAGLKTYRTTALLLLEASATNTNLAPAGRPAKPGAGVATTACEAVLAAVPQLLVVKGGFAPGDGSTRQKPSTPSGTQKCPPPALLASHTPPRGSVSPLSTIAPSLAVVCPY